MDLLIQSSNRADGNLASTTDTRRCSLSVSSTMADDSPDERHYAEINPDFEFLHMLPPLGLQFVTSRLGWCIDDDGE
jgi:hypothetical protein